MLDTLEIAREPVLDPFKAAFSEMSKAYVECRDNVKFLNTLERHFKALATGTLAVTTESIPSLLNGLRMVWTVSRHYNTDDQMLPMMKRIVNEITDKVASEVNIKSILRQARVAPEEAHATMKGALELLE
jgi:dynein heavy chain